MSSFKKTCVFICTEKDGCGACGSRKLLKDLRKLVKRSDEDMGAGYKIVESGCLGHCSKAIVAVAFPENRVFTRLEKREAPRVLAELEESRRRRAFGKIRSDSVPDSQRPLPLSH